jgi:hypothetical protein
MNVKFIDIVHRVVADYGAPNPRNLGRFNSLLADYALGKYRRERRALMEALQRADCADIDKAIASVKMLSLPDPERIKNTINKSGSNVQRGIHTAGTVGAEVVKTGVAVAGTVVKAAGELVKGGYEAIGGAEGVQRGAEAAGKVAKEVLKVGAILTIEAGKVIAGTIKEVAQEVQTSRDRQNNRKLLNGPDDYIDYYLMDDDDD